MGKSGICQSLIGWSLRGVTRKKESSREIGDFSSLFLFISLIQSNFIYSIFVAHRGVDLENRPPNGHPYWKARVESMHRLDDATCLLIVAWFYSPSDVENDVGDIVSDE